MRAFEAVARLESFVAAAEELSVTPGAVSQHIKSLEAWAGVALFRRNAQGVELTSAGRSLVTIFVDAFDALATATHSLRNLRPDVEIHLAVLPSVAQLWLPSRLSHIREQYPHLKFSVTALETPPSFARGLFDLSLFFEIPSDNPDQITIAQDQIFPVCARNLAERLETPEQLNTVPLLQDQTWQDDWVKWSRASGVLLDDPKAGPRYSLYSLAVEEAKSGAGVLMGHACLVQDALRAGTLVSMFGTACASGRSLVLSLPHRARRRPEIDEIAKLLGK